MKDMIDIESLIKAKEAVGKSNYNWSFNRIEIEEGQVYLFKNQTLIGIMSIEVYRQLIETKK